MVESPKRAIPAQPLSMQVVREALRRRILVAKSPWTLLSGSPVCPSEGVRSPAVQLRSKVGVGDIERGGCVAGTWVAALRVDATGDGDTTADGDATGDGNATADVGAVRSDSPAGPGELVPAEHAAAVDISIAPATIWPHKVLTRQR